MQIWWTTEKVRNLLKVDLTLWWTSAFPFRFSHMTSRNMRLKYSATKCNYLWWCNCYPMHISSLSLLWMAWGSQQLPMWCRDNLMPIITKKSIAGKISLEIVLALVIDFHFFNSIGEHFCDDSLLAYLLQVQ